jgi:hypothetical protein
MKSLLLLAPAILFLVFAGCTSAKRTGHGKIPGPSGKLIFRDEFDFPNSMFFNNTIVGGLSGIDYDKQHDLYYLICDDPGERGPSRFYTARILISPGKIDSVRIIAVTPLLNADGKLYSDIRQDRGHSLDAEALRYNPDLDEFIYSSEGQRYADKAHQWLIQNPAIYSARRDGSFKDSFELPQNMYFRKTENGPRHNGVFEGLCFTEDLRFLFVSLEEPRYEDGLQAATGDSTSWIRFIKFDMKTRKQVAQFAYQTEAVPYPPTKPGDFKMNGVSDILYAGNNRFLVTERAFMTGRKSTTIRIFMADAGDATDVSAIGSLQENGPFKPIRKNELLNMEKTGRYTDNIEGATFGPRLPNGHQTVLFIADDNFSANQKSQLLLFEFIP